MISGHKNVYEAFDDDFAALGLCTQPVSNKQKRKFVINFQGSSVGT